VPTLRMNSDASGTKIARCRLAQVPPSPTLYITAPCFHDSAKMLALSVCTFGLCQTGLFYYILQGILYISLQPRPLPPPSGAMPMLPTNTRFWKSQRAWKKASGFQSRRLRTSFLCALCSAVQQPSHEAASESEEQPPYHMDLKRLWRYAGCVEGLPRCGR
jgi:hypothetical protein